MTLTTWQKFFATVALFLLLCPCLKFSEKSVIYADVFLIIAVFLNIGELTRIHAFQIPFFLAVPFFLLSSLLDADGDIIPVLQILYIFGFLLPFGWAAFTNLTASRIAQVLLLSACANAVVGAGQFMELIDEIGEQFIINFGLQSRRAAGLNIQCNALAMTLTPLFLLLVYVRKASWRTGVLLALIVGMVSTISKSTILAFPGLLFHLFFCEPKKKHVFQIMLFMSIVAAVFLERNQGLSEIWYGIQESALHRIDHAQDSMADRNHLIQIAFDYAPECYLIGYGIEGTRRRMTQVSDNTVHVYFIGLVLIAGMVATLLILTGIAALFASLWKAKQYSYALYLLAHLLACLVSTVLLLSFQYVPYMVAAAVLVRQTRSALATCETSTGSWTASAGSTAVGC